MEVSNIITVTFFLAVHASSHPPGHLKPLGSHLPPILDITTLQKFPSPVDFYEQYVKDGKPILFKNVLENVDIPAYYKWTDDYLAKHYGNLKVDVELGKKEDRTKGDLVRKKLSYFLNRYKYMDAYMVEDLRLEMKKDMAIPSSLRCGGFQKSIQTIVMWFSSGGTKSHLHLDHLDNINCLIDGKKDLVLIDKKYADLVEADGYNADGTFSNVDVDSVDMYKFPKFQDIPWYQVNLTKGDCFYIPYKWYHHVYSHPGRNFAVNVWFYHLWWFNVSDCNGVDPELSSAIPYTEFENPLKIEEFRDGLLSSIGENNYISKTLFSEALKQPETDNDFVADDIFNMIDQNNDGKLSMEEMYSFGDEIFNTISGKHKQSHSLDEKDSKTENDMTENLQEDSSVKDNKYGSSDGNTRVDSDGNTRVEL